ncbi:LysE family translocator [Pseudoalteromonas ardens]|uniref:Amino acid transporter n=1 Tax=Pseudoalteromonas rubra TaxID=43658 RepID=A0A0L0EM62_9GAMM|nr:LysE family translocator [Pseudoalteromonas sp. R96]KNC65445.1 amino acid transporter [Pseudoalteromonas rubra]MDK1310549.1 LysE family translocator [Pseudoalteromonas sp. R96]
MIDITLLPLFFTTIFFLVISPGPDLLLLSSYSATKGFRAGAFIALGILSAGLVQTALVAFGLGQVMQTMPLVALIVKLIGAAYLAYLGVKMLLHWYKHRRITPSGSDTAPTDSGLNGVELIKRGCFNNLLNPKALLFFSLFLPQFTTAEHGLTAQLIVLGLMLSLFAFGINLLFAAAFSNLAKTIATRAKGIKRWAVHLDGVLGTLFIALSARLALSK